MMHSAPVMIIIDRPAGTSFGNTMNQIRSWLDSNKIEPVYFKPVTRNGGIGFEISFRNPREAESFQREFI